MTRILVVEDEPTIAAGLQDDLELEGYTVEVVDNGPTAAERALEGSYDLILLDVMLPQKDGFTVCRELREAGLRTPIILLTAKAQEIDKVLGLELGADDYVTKPFSPRELLARIKAVLRRVNGSTQPGQVYQFGEVQVDFRRCQVSRKKKQVNLTAIEFKLLRAFLSHGGQVLTLDQLIEEVWGNDVFLSDRVIYTHLNNLRNKIEPNPAKPQHLITVRGIGYRFDS